MTRRPFDPGSFTLVDELIASPSAPMPAKDAAVRVGAARRALEAIQTAPAPRVMDWRICAMVGNVLEEMIRLGFAQDPDGLLQDAQAALKEAADRALGRDVPIRLTGPGLTSVTWLIDSFEEALAVAPHRMMIRAFRETEKRMIAISCGERRPHDYVARAA